jgi:hypothetical protein
MMCECFGYGHDDKDSAVAMVIGHHPACPNFKIDKYSFAENLRTHAQRIADRILIDEMPKLKAMYEPKKPKEIKFESEQYIQNKIYSWRFGGHSPIVPNAQLFCGENDIISVTKSGYIHEYEIKVSKADFKADFKKVEKHKLLEEVYSWNIRKKYHSGDYYNYPNYFYYATPENLIDVSEIPAYAGLIEFSQRFPCPTAKKKAPLLHKDKISEKVLVNLYEKCYYRYWNLRLK